MGIGRKTMAMVHSLYERKSMEMVRHVYERMRRTTRIYRALAVTALVVAAGLGARLYFVNRRMAAIRHQAADVFYRLKALELQVARLSADAPERKEYNERRAGLEAVYSQWIAQLDQNSTERADVRAIRAAVARLGEAPVLVSGSFISDVRRRVAEWRRTPDYRNAVRAAAENRIPERIESVLVANNLPPDLVWLAFQESRFLPTAVGPPTRFGYAKGMWQLLPATARQYGLRVGPLVGEPRYDPRDQRHDVTRATGAAVRYVGDLYLVDAQGSGLLVMASYNAGQTLVLRLLRSLPATPQDRNFWQLLEHHRDEIPDETYGYVVGIVAAAAAAAEPQAFGLPAPPPARSAGS
jgi:soluble lytic murein transglycosylase-like protein